MIPIKDFLDKFPGGNIIIPLLIGCTLNTFWPEALAIGSFTTGIATGTSAFMGALFLCLGAQLNIKCAPKAMKTGFTLLITKVVVAVSIGWIAGKFFGDSLFGLSMLAIVAAVSNSNGAMYATLTAKYGTESDQGAMAIISFNDGPFITMMVMGVAGSASIPYMSVVAAVIPLALGMILGNLDEKMRKCLSNGMEPIIMVLCFAVGCTMSIYQVIEGGLSGVLLGLIALLVGGAATIFADRLTGGSGIAGASISSVAANAIATPAAIVAIDSSLGSIAGVATAQIAAASIVTCLLTPFLTAWVAKKNKKVL